MDFSAPPFTENYSQSSQEILHSHWQGWNATQVQCVLSPDRVGQWVVKEGADIY